MPSTASADPAFTSGIAIAPTGERHIPSSTRSDGSVRKEIRVRPGYRPPEDVEVYKNRTADAWKDRGKGGVPGADFLSSSEGVASTGKKTKRNSPAGTAKAVPRQAPTSVGAQNIPETASKSGTPTDPEAEKEREAKKLSKKLRQARELQQKKENGDSLLPEQFEKVIRINELIRQLNNLGFDAEGERKT